jgi:hypothetical protein
MQAFHLPVGPSELHFLGAMPIYLALGFVPTLFGFAIGLLAQGLIFAPADLVHLGVNFLSLAVPLVLVHATLGKRLDTARTRSTASHPEARRGLLQRRDPDGRLLAGHGRGGHALSPGRRSRRPTPAIVAVEPVITLLVLPPSPAAGQRPRASASCPGAPER